MREVDMVFFIKVYVPIIYSTYSEKIRLREVMFSFFLEMKHLLSLFSLIN